MFGHLLHRHQVPQTYIGTGHYYSPFILESRAHPRPSLCLPSASTSNQATAALEQDDDDDTQANAPTHSDSPPHAQDQIPYCTSQSHGRYQKRCCLLGASPPRRLGQCLCATTQPLPPPAAAAPALELRAATPADARAATHG